MSSTKSTLTTTPKPKGVMTWSLFARALWYVLKGKLFIHHGHLPLQNHTVPNNFIGIGIATAHHSATDDYVINALREIGINEVRLDFTYGDLDGFNARFLQRLIDEQFAISLHIVPPQYAAKHMESALELQTFETFLTATLDRFGAKIKQLEFGNTINRRRWAGFTQAGFLNAWAIAYQAAKKRNIVLAGPNITDFELAYNIGILSVLKSRKQLPDVHTNNLFSERISQPERYDHRILSVRWSTVLRVNLIKKARLLKKITTDFGIPKLISPAAFWAIYRIERVLVAGIEKQADYAARYMLLNAASGALHQAFWGTFICHREGLINDGLTDAEYPALERIAHYVKVDGELKNFVHYPSFNALKTVSRLIQGATYHRTIATTTSAQQGLELHHFSSAKHEIHAVWCINGRVALLNHLYSNADIFSAEIISRDGAVIKPAATEARQKPMASESPLYLLWPAGYLPRVVSKPILAPSLAIYRHMPQYDYYPFEADGWFGMMLAKNADEAALLLAHLHPNKLARPQKSETLRDARNAIWALPDPRDSTKKITVKQPVRMYPHKAFFDRFKPSKSKRSWSGAFELLRRGIDTAQPVAFFEKIGDLTLKENFYLCDFVTTECDVGRLMSHFAQGNDSYTSSNNVTVSAESVYSQLANYLNQLHTRGAFFRDLSGGNVLVNINTKGQLHFSLIDTARARFYNHAASLSQRMSDMTRICNKLHWAGRKRLMGLYLANLGLKFSFKHQLSFYSYDFKVALKRTIGRKGINKLIARFK